MAAISIGSVSTSGSTLRCPVSYDGRLRRFLSGEPFVADYDVELDSVPESVAVVPVLAHVCPVAWANGATVRVPRVDAEFLESLRAVGNELVEMYPSFMRGGRIEAGEAVENDAGVGSTGTGDARAPAGDRVRAREVRRDGSGRPRAAATEAAMLFSGGVDSLATYVRHREEAPALVSVQGWVLDRDQPERWSRVRRGVERFADARGVASHAVSSNMLEFLHTPMLQAHYKRYVDGAWYSSVGHGLGLLGLCAPLAYARGYSTLYVAATHTEAFDEPWGSHPRIDERVRWTGTRAVHDGYGLTRQEKLGLIADYVRSGNDDVTLRTCIHSATGANCGRCEKCYRTIAGLVLAGLDPNGLGYDVDGGTFEDARTALESGRFVLGEDERFMWQDLKRHVPAEGEYPWPGAAAFFDWLRSADVDALVERSGVPLLDRLVRAGMRHTPYPLYARVYSIYDRARAMAAPR